MASTALIRRAAFYQTEIGAHLGAGDPVWQQKSRVIATYLGHQMGAANGRGGAMGLMYGMLQQQSALRSYTDVFRWTALLAFFCAGAVWMFKKPEKHVEPPAGAH
jgi:hypothetical protein